MGKKTIRIDINEDQEAKLKSLMEEFNLSSEAEVLNNAVTLLDWAKGQLKAGRKIAAVDENAKAYKEVKLKIFGNIRKPE